MSAWLRCRARLQKRTIAVYKNVHLFGEPQQMLFFFIVRQGLSYKVNLNNQGWLSDKPKMQLNSLTTDLQLPVHDFCLVCIFLK